MSKKVVKYSLIGFGLYAVLAAGVLTFYEDNPDQMRWDDRQAYNKKYINELSIDEPIFKERIIQSLGSPDITEAKILNGETFQVMFYRTKHEKSDGITTKDECTPLLFKDGKLIAWGISAFEQFDAIRI
ncbi:DUF3192 domain-containing protein [Psychrosphaera haliotis]|uniref:DUF3192 domain-containing protein n=1 Tax=Psychrosphaera haliotis TaxID=555083 RepID=A0A6N8FAE9_9GAMM|nr:DUF3192 domain-containing protein [Psychrosphaera haliotis]MUH71742.1 DUF3192 domain-containing protein [Psychrosphaera haliotis]